MQRQLMRGAGSFRQRFGADARLSQLEGASVVDQPINRGVALHIPHVRGLQMTPVNFQRLYPRDGDPFPHDQPLTQYRKITALGLRRQQRPGIIGVASLESRRFQRNRAGPPVKMIGQGLHIEAGLGIQRASREGDPTLARLGQRPEAKRGARLPGPQIRVAVLEPCHLEPGPRPHAELAKVQLAAPEVQLRVFAQANLSPAVRSLGHRQLLIAQIQREPGRHPGITR